MIKDWISAFFLLLLARVLHVSKLTGQKIVLGKKNKGEGGFFWRLLVLADILLKELIARIVVVAGLENFRIQFVLRSLKTDLVMGCDGLISDLI